MSSNLSIVLLDTMVVAGLFAGKQKHKNIEQHINEWKRAIKSLASNINNRCLFRVPTPVCYELMCWCIEWRNIVLNSSSTIFYYKSYSIPNHILETASLYSLNSNIDCYDEHYNKVKTLDPIIAAYCLTYGYYLLTENQKDFPENHFKIDGIETIKLQQKSNITRRFLYLLSPKVC